MDSADDQDATLNGISAQFIVCFAQFIDDCDLFDKSELSDEALVPAQETYPLEHSAVHLQWRHALKQLGKLSAQTRTGAYGKVCVIRCCFEHGLAFDDDVTLLIKSLILDLDRVLHDGPDCAFELSFTRSSTDFKVN